MEIEKRTFVFRLVCQQICFDFYVRCLERKLDQYPIQRYAIQLNRVTQTVSTIKQR